MAGGTEFRFVTEGIQSISWTTSTCARWAMNARNTSRANVRSTSSCGSTR